MNMFKYISLEKNYIFKLQTMFSITKFYKNDNKEVIVTLQTHDPYTRQRQWDIKDQTLKFKFPISKEKYFMEFDY